MVSPEGEPEGVHASLLTHTAVDKPQIFTSCLLEILIPCHTSLLYKSAHNMVSALLRASVRSREGKTERQYLCNPVLEVITHHICQLYLLECNH